MGFEIENGVLKKYTKEPGVTEVVIPDGVTSIGDYAFSNCRSLKSITIPDGVTSIGNYAFYDCSRLKSITIPDSVTSIGESAFWDCSSLTSITIPDSVTSIGREAFEECSSLTSVTIPNGVTDIGYSAFWGCSSLTSITIPEGVKYICGHSFVCCSNLKSVTIPDSVISVSDDAFTSVDKLSIHIDDLSILPAEYRKCAVCGFADEGADFTTERGKKYLKYIKSHVSKWADFAALRPELIALLCREKLIPAKDLDAYMAAVQSTGNTELIALMLDYDANKISKKEKQRAADKKERTENEVFDRMLARQSVEGISGLTVAATGRLKIFSNREELKSYVESKGGKLAASVSSKVDLLITNEKETSSEKMKKAAELGIEVITENEFIERAGVYFSIEKGCLTRYIGRAPSVEIPSTVQIISDKVFQGCASLKNVTLQAGIKKIGDIAFRECKNLTTITIPDTLTQIGDLAFYKCEKLSDISIPDTVKRIGDGAFCECSGLADKDGFVIVRDVLHSYHGKSGDVIIPDGVISIGQRAFHGSKTVKNITIPNSVKYIGGEAFCGCNSLQSIVIPEGVTSIQWGTFENCPNLSEITIGEGVKRISGHAFIYCNKLERITIPKNVAIIEIEAFKYSRHLSDITILDASTKLGWRAFDDCPKLTIHAPAGSYAEQYAKEYKIPFVAE